jgi:hypothetical protein
MSSFEVRFNALAMNVYVPPNIFTIDRPMRVLFTGHKPQWDGPRIVLRVDTSEGAMGRIFVPKPLQHAFTLGDLGWSMNSGEVSYNLIVRPHPVYHDNCHFEIRRRPDG